MTPRDAPTEGPPGGEKGRTRSTRLKTARSSSRIAGNCNFHVEPPVASDAHLRPRISAWAWAGRRPYVRRDPGQQFTRVNREGEPSPCGAPPWGEGGTRRRCRESTSSWFRRRTWRGNLGLLLLGHGGTPCLSCLFPDGRRPTPNAGQASGGEASDRHVSRGRDPRVHRAAHHAPLRQDHLTPLSGLAGYIRPDGASGWWHGKLLGVRGVTHVFAKATPLARRVTRSPDQAGRRRSPMPAAGAPATGDVSPLKMTDLDRGPSGVGHVTANPRGRHARCRARPPGRHRWVRSPAWSDGARYRMAVDHLRTHRQRKNPGDPLGFDPVVNLQPKLNLALQPRASSLDLFNSGWSTGPPPLTRGRRPNGGKPGFPGCPIGGCSSALRMIFTPNETIPCVDDTGRLAGDAWSMHTRPAFRSLR